MSICDSLNMGDGNTIIVVPIFRVCRRGLSSPLMSQHHRSRCCRLVPLALTTSLHIAAQGLFALMLPSSDHQADPKATIVVCVDVSCLQQISDNKGGNLVRRERGRKELRSSLSGRTATLPLDLRLLTRRASPWAAHVATPLDDRVG
jgi:hypothetical protein